MTDIVDKIAENDDPAKVRKSLLTVAIATIFFANIQLTANELSILGLKLVIEPARLVALGRLASGLLLVIFLLRSLPRVLKSLGELHQRYITKKELQLRSQIYKEFEHYYDPSPDNEDGEDRYGPDTEIKYLKSKMDGQRKHFEGTYSAWVFRASSTADIMLDYSLPLASGVIAACFPYALSEVITCLARNPSAP